MKCLIDSESNITGVWEDESAPANSVECDKTPELIGEGDPTNTTYFYKLVDGKVTPTEAGKVWEAKKYQRDRQYPRIGDQLDEIYHKGIDEWKKTIKAVKDAHPKPSE